MKILSCVGKFLDQPKLINGLNRSMPMILVGGAGFVIAKQTLESDNKSKTFIKETATLLGVVGSSLLAVKGLKFRGKQIFEGLIHNHSKAVPNEVADRFSKAVNDNEIKKIIEKSKTKILSFKNITKLMEHAQMNPEGQKFMDEFIPSPHSHNAKEILGEIKRLSLIGLVPVLGGIVGGTVGDGLTDESWRSKIPDKLKEGFYQYFANIFLCNIGAGAALAATEVLEAKKVIKPSKVTRAAAMVGGVLGVGVFGGSAIANLMGQKVINPIFKHKKHGKIYDERVPDALDISLHVDDMASVGVLSGFKWVEPALPLLYSVSGYRAGIGYRNHHHHHGYHKDKKEN
ncbi:MAG: hypothetical protein WCF95_00085 [bacterium]